MDALKSFFASRLAQLAARYVGIGLVWAAAKLNVNPAPDALNVTAETIAALAAAAILFCFDLIVHHFRDETPPNPTAARLLILALFLAGLSGCFSKPAAVDRAVNLKKQALQSYEGNTAKILEAVLTAYRAAEFARIDTLLDLDIQKVTAANAGKPVELGVAIDGMKKLMLQREAAQRAVEEQIFKLRETVARAKTDLVIAQKLDDVLQQYADVGVDTAIADKAVSEILGLLKK